MVWAMSFQVINLLWSTHYVEGIKEGIGERGL